MRKEAKHTRTHRPFSRSVLSLALSNPDILMCVTEASQLVVKAQILAGGRGLGTFSNGFKGGVHLCKTYVNFERIIKKTMHRSLLWQCCG